MGTIDIHIGEMLARNARMVPDGLALVERIPAEKKRTEITWKQFDEGANRCANALIRKGIKKGDKVVHLMMNSIDWLIAYFGIIRTGAWCVPLNFRFTASDRSFFELSLRAQRSNLMIGYCWRMISFSISPVWLLSPAFFTFLIV